MLNKISLSLLFVFFSSFSLLAQSSNKKVRVLSFNIYHGATMNNDFNLDYIAKIISTSEPDFVCLQEVDFKTKRSHGLDIATELGQRTKLAPLFGKAMDFDGGAYGVGILSKYPILSSTVVNLPYSENKEPRVALAIQSQLPSGDTLTVISTHLDHLEDDSDRIKQVNMLNSTFLSSPFPIVLAGDLNDTPHSPSINLIEKYWQPSYTKHSPAPTYPSDAPEKKIDYVLSAPQGSWIVRSSEVIDDSMASDHCAYLVELELIE